MTNAAKPTKLDGSEREEKAQKSFYAVLATTFATVFLAELGDKTQIATLLLSAQSGRPLIVFAGAAFALICSSLVGVLVGRWMSSVLPPERFEKLAGVLMLGLGCWLGFEATRSLILNTQLA